MLLYLLLVLDHIDVFHNVCIRGRDLLGIHGLLGRMLCLLQVYFLILCSTCLCCFLVKILLSAQSWLARSFALTCSADCNCRLSMSCATWNFGLWRPCYSQSLCMLMVLSYPVAHVVVHFSRWLRLVLRMGKVSAWVLSTFIQLLWAYSRVTLIVGCQGTRLVWWDDFTLFENLTRFFYIWFRGHGVVMWKDTLLVECIINSFWCADAVIIWISTLLLFVHILAQTSLLLRR